MSWGSRAPLYGLRHRRTDSAGRRQSDGTPLPPSAVPPRRRRPVDPDLAPFRAILVGSPVGFLLWLGVGIAIWWWLA